jgi:mono/diheme cytochrome c family protein
MKIRTEVILGMSALLVGSLAMLPVADSQEAFPDQPGRDTLLLACTQCHSLGKMVAANLTADDWEFIVYDMISRGAPVHQDEIKDLTKYLQSNFTMAKD